MSIDILIPNFDDLGAQRVAINVANVLAKKHAVRFVVFEDGGPFRHYLDAKIPVVMLDKNIARVPKVRVLLRAFAYARWVRRNKTQIAISFSPITNYVALAAKFRNPHLKTVIQEHGFPSLFLKDRENVTAFYEFFFRHLGVKWYNHSDAFVTPAAAVKEDFEKNFGTRKNFMRVIRNPLDIAAIERLAHEPVKDFHFDPQKNYFINAGRLAEQKNQARLINIFHRVCQQRPHDVELIILGKGSLEHGLREQAARLGIADKVHLLGFKSNPYAYITRSDCFCLSSNWEALPQILAEAMICKTAVIANDCQSGPAEMIENEKTGLLIPYGDEVAFADAILLLLADPAKKDALRANAEVFARREYSLEKCGEEYEELIRTLIASRK